MKRIGFITFMIWSLLACQSESNKQEAAVVETPSVQVPLFQADSAYAYVAKQVAFGPRVPNSKAHRQTGDWIIQQLKAWGWEVQEQPFTAVTYDGVKLKSRNIIASYQPQVAKRILLGAHWDTRPMADKDVARVNEAIDGANDGGSGVGVLLEIARSIQASSVKPQVGIDMIFFDAEDWGAPSSSTAPPINAYGGYCLGSDYWAKNPHKPGYSAYFGILLDMVGAKGAQFRYDTESMQAAPSVVRRVWDKGASLGFGRYFIFEEAGGLIDDHIPVIREAKIPMIDIIDLRKNDKFFFDEHHTHGDSMPVIDKSTLQAVGQTVLAILFEETAEVS
ncbi:MAG: M28 family peptidase [Spirosomataceae bacterium]